MLRPLRALAALALSAFMLAGCMKVDMDLTISGREDVVNGSLIFAVDKQVLALSGKPIEESFEDVQDGFDAKTPTGTRSEVFDDGKFYGRKVIFTDVPLSEFNNQDAEAPRITHEGGQYRFTMAANMAAPQDNPGVQQLMNSIEIKVAVTFPGKVIEHDPKGVLEDRTVRWNLKMSENHQLLAVSEEPSSFPWLLLAAVAGLLGILVVLGIIVLFMRQNRKEPALIPVQAGPAGEDEPTAQIVPIEPTSIHPASTWNQPTPIDLPKTEPDQK